MGGNDGLKEGYDTVYHDGSLGTYALVLELLKKVPNVMTVGNDDGSFTIFTEHNTAGAIVPANSRVHLRENLDIEIRNEAWDTPLVLHFISDKSAEVDEMLGAEGYSTEELMEMGEAILTKAHTQDVVEREERDSRDDIIDEADKSFDEAMTNDGYKVRSESEEEFMGKMGERAEAVLSDEVSVEMEITEDGVGISGSVDEVRVMVAKLNGMFDEGVITNVDKFIVEKVVGVMLGDELSVETLRNVVSFWNDAPDQDSPAMKSSDDLVEATYTATEHHEALEKAYQSGLQEGKNSATTGNTIIQNVENYHA